MLNIRLLSLSLVACLATVAGSATAKEITPEEAIAQFKQRQNYQPTYVTMGYARWLFDRLPNLNHKSQCFQRAEVWSDALYENYKVNTFKVMMFYTPKFRNEYLSFEKGGFFSSDSYSQYRWWFHTAPVVFVVDKAAGINTPTPIVLDKEFTSEPKTLDQWSHFFLYNEIFEPGPGILPEANVSRRKLSMEETHCPIIDNFRDYAVPALMDLGPGKSKDLSDFLSFENRHENDPWCMMRLYPMYYMQPVDLQQMDCDPARDPDYTAGLTGKHGTGIGRAALSKYPDGRFAHICVKGAPITLYNFRKSDLDWAKSVASPR